MTTALSTFLSGTYNGFTGSRGDTGFVGSVGFTGSIGFTGSRGNTGFTGSIGGLGFTGSAGPAGASGQLEWIRVTENYTATGQNGIIADTTASSFTVTLPATPTIGAVVVIADGADFQINNLTVARNGSTIENIAEDLIIDIGNVRVDFIYDGTTWEVFPNIGQTGFTGSQGVGFTGSRGLPGDATTGKAIALSLIFG